MFFLYCYTLTVLQRTVGLSVRVAEQSVNTKFLNYAFAWLACVAGTCSCSSNLCLLWTLSTRQLLHCCETSYTSWQQPPGVPPRRIVLLCQRCLRVLSSAFPYHELVFCSSIAASLNSRTSFFRGDEWVGPHSSHCFVVPSWKSAAAGITLLPD